MLMAQQITHPGAFPLSSICSAWHCFGRLHILGDSMFNKKCLLPGGRQSRRPASKVLPIPGASKEPQQRMTRAQASRAALESKQKETSGKAQPAAEEPLQEGASPHSADPLIFLAVSTPSLWSDDPASCFAGFG